MIKLRKYFIAVFVITAWGLFSFAYLGREDGSSGLSILGLIHAFFFIPGGFLFHIFRDSHSNRDIPAMATLSWLIYTTVVLAGIKLAHIIQILFSDSQ